jgi:hypothetical protein
MIKFIRFLFQPGTWLVFLLLPVAYFNVSGIGETLYARAKTKAHFDHDMGIQFADFIPLLKGETKIGYITNKDLSSESNDGQFLQAQYALAPIVLDLNGKSNKFNIIDCTDQRSIMYALQQTNSIPVKLNQYGKILSIMK